MRSDYENGNGHCSNKILPKLGGGIRDSSKPFKFVSRDKDLKKEKLKKEKNDSFSNSQYEKFSAMRTGNILRYKTELCRLYEESGSCKYGESCTFAHGFQELRAVPRHPRYKTEACRTYHTLGFCQYGTRCHFIHGVDELQGIPLVRSHAFPFKEIKHVPAGVTEGENLNQDVFVSNIHGLYALMQSTTTNVWQWPSNIQSLYPYI
ncbi:UNVERIFIED_CONTAM: hypothetical protein RMT77_003470 [Armadillidium vulgare]